MEAAAFLSAEKIALRLIARAEQNTNGISRKLEKRGYEASCVSAVIEKLISLKLIDDNRYAQLWLESRLRLPRTPRRLLAALCAKGIERNDAENALKKVFSNEETEYALLLRFIKKHERKKNRKNDDAKSLKYLLKNEGFSIGVIQRYLEE